MDLRQVKTAPGRRLRHPVTKQVMANAADPAGTAHPVDFHDPHWYRAHQRGDIVEVKPTAAEPTPTPTPTVAVASTAAPAVTAAPATTAPASTAAPIPTPAPSVTAAPAPTTAPAPAPGTSLEGQS